MTTESNRAIVRRYVEGFKNGHDPAVIDEVFAPDFVHHFDLPGLPSGRAGFGEVGAAFLAAFPDVRVTVEDLLADGDKVVERNLAEATHIGPFQGLPPTGRRVRWSETHVYRLAGGKIVENWPQVDFAGLLRQLQPAAAGGGAEPAPTTAPSLGAAAP